MISAFLALLISQVPQGFPLRLPRLTASLTARLRMEEDLEAAGLLRDVAQAILAAFAALDRRFERDGVEGREDLHNCKGRFLIWTDGLAVVEGELDKCLESHEAIRECVSALMGDLGLVLTTST